MLIQSSDFNSLALLIKFEIVNFGETATQSKNEKINLQGLLRPLPIYLPIYSG